mgnify:CR=1 FL=1
MYIFNSLDESVKEKAAWFENIGCHIISIRFNRKGTNPLADYLARNTIKEAESYAKDKPWTRVIWDVTAVAWLLNDDDRFMKGVVRPMLIPGHDGHYESEAQPFNMRYIFEIRRDILMEDLFSKLLK